MRTGVYIQKQYEKEISRILQELEIAKRDILAEIEILELQSRVKVHANLVEGTFGVHLSCGGGIVLFIPNGINWINICRIEMRQPAQEYDFNAPLCALHIAKLKKCHPKMAGQMLRQLAKTALLDQPETPSKKWWEFWK